MPDSPGELEPEGSASYDPGVPASLTPSAGSATPGTPGGLTPEGGGAASPGDPGNLTPSTPPSPVAPQGIQPSTPATPIDPPPNIQPETPPIIPAGAQWATQEQAEAGISSNTLMSPLRTKQAFDEFGVVKADSDAGNVSPYSQEWREAVILANTPYGRSAPGAKRPVIVFIDDDSKSSVMSKILPIVQSKGIPVSIATVTGAIGTAGYLTEANLATLKAAGCEVCSHTHTHTSLTSLTKSQLINELDTSLNWLRSRGYESTHLVYPYGDNNGLVRTEVSKRFRDATKVGGFRDYRDSSYTIPRIALGAFTEPGNNTYEFYKSCVDQAVESNGLCVFMMHSWDADFDATQEGYFEDIIDYIQSIDVDILNISDALLVHGTRYEEQPNESGTEKYRVGGDSVVRDGATLDLNSFDSDTPITSFPATVMSRMPVTSMALGYPGFGFGLLTTHRTYGPDNYNGHQYFRIGDSSRILTRHWKLDNTWSDWSEIAIKSGGASTPRLEWWPSFGVFNGSNELTTANIAGPGLSEPEYTSSLWKRTAGANEIVRSGGGDGSSSANGRLRFTIPILHEWTVLVSARLLVAPAGNVIGLAMGNMSYIIATNGHIIMVDNVGNALVGENVTSISSDLKCYGISWDGTTLRGCGKTGSVGTSSAGASITTIDLSGTAFGIPGTNAVHGPIKVLPFGLGSIDLKDAVEQWESTVNR